MTNRKTKASRCRASIRHKPKVVKALPKVGVAVALPKDHVPVLALHIDKNMLHVVPVPKAAVKKNWWERFLVWSQGLDANIDG
jgi:hypothetical protein